MNLRTHSPAPAIDRAPMAATEDAAGFATSLRPAPRQPRRRSRPFGIQLRHGRQALLAIALIFQIVICILFVVYAPNSNVYPASGGELGLIGAY